MHPPATRVVNTYTGLQMEHEAAVCRRIDKAQPPRFQRFIACDARSSNPLHMPYLALSWAEGVSLRWTDSTLAAASYWPQPLSGPHALLRSSRHLQVGCESPRCDAAEPIDPPSLFMHADGLAHADRGSGFHGKIAAGPNMVRYSSRPSIAIQS